MTGIEEAALTVAQAFESDTAVPLQLCLYMDGGRPVLILMAKGKAGQDIWDFCRSQAEMAGPPIRFETGKAPV